MATPLKPGIGAQIEIDEGPLFDQLITVSPYYQTDFRGIAQAYGFSASWEPFNSLGGWEVPTDGSRL